MLLQHEEPTAVSVVCSSLSLFRDIAAAARGANRFLSYAAAFPYFLTLLLQHEGPTACLSYAAAFLCNVTLLLLLLLLLPLLLLLLQHEEPRAFLVGCSSFSFFRDIAAATRGANRFFCRMQQLFLVS